MARVPANALQVFSDLQAAGLSPGAAAGVTGNLVAESSVNPGAVGDKGTSHGIAQWHNQRWTQLVTWARAKGLDPTALKTQTAYLIGELKSMGVWTKLTATTDPNTAAAVVMSDFEKPASKDPTGRQALARQVLAAATGTTVPAPSGAAAGAGTATNTATNTGLSLGLGDAAGGAKMLLIEGLGVALAGGLVILGLSKTFPQLGAVGRAVTKVV